MLSCLLCASPVLVGCFVFVFWVIPHYNYWLVFDTTLQLDHVTVVYRIQILFIFVHSALGILGV